MSVLDEVLEDLPELYPGLTRAGIEQVVQLLDQQPAEDSGLSLASALAKLTPGIAERLQSLSGGDVEEYVRMLRAAATLVLQQWKPDGPSPDAHEIANAVANIED
jgi:hypothetical protein